MWTLKYTENNYKAKISKLESYATELDEHLDNLENLKSQVWDFWNDPNAEEYLNNLTKMILACRNARTQINNLRREFNSIVDKMSTSNQLTKDVINDATDVISALGIGSSGSK